MNCTWLITSENNFEWCTVIEIRFNLFCAYLPNQKLDVDVDVDVDECSMSRKKCRNYVNIH